MAVYDVVALRKSPTFLSRIGTGVVATEWLLEYLQVNASSPMTTVIPQLGEAHLPKWIQNRGR